MPQLSCADELKRRKHARMLKDFGVGVKMTDTVAGKLFEQADLEAANARKRKAESEATQVPKRVRFSNDHNSIDMITTPNVPPTESTKVLQVESSGVAKCSAGQLPRRKFRKATPFPSQISAIRQETNGFRLPMHSRGLLDGTSNETGEKPAAEAGEEIEQQSVDFSRIATERHPSDSVALAADDHDDSLFVPLASTSPEPSTCNQSMLPVGTTSCESTSPLYSPTSPNHHEPHEHAGPFAVHPPTLPVLRRTVQHASHSPKHSPASQNSSVDWDPNEHPAGFSPITRHTPSTSHSQETPPSSFTADDAANDIKEEVELENMPANTFATRHHAFGLEGDGGQHVDNVSMTLLLQGVLTTLERFPQELARMVTPLVEHTGRLTHMFMVQQQRLHEIEQRRDKHETENHSNFRFLYSLTQSGRTMEGPTPNYTLASRRGPTPSYTLGSRRGVFNANTRT